MLVLAVLGQQLDSMILKIFSNLNDYVIEKVILIMRSFIYIMVLLWKLFSKVGK